MQSNCCVTCHFNHSRRNKLCRNCEPGTANIHSGYPCTLALIFLNAFHTLVSNNSLKNGILLFQTLSWDSSFTLASISIRLSWPKYFGDCNQKIFVEIIEDAMLFKTLISANLQILTYDPGKTSLKTHNSKAYGPDVLKH